MKEQVIKNRFTSETIFKCEANSLKSAIKIAIQNRENLYQANLRRVDLYGVNLQEANLCEADLYQSDLCGTNLSGANLYKADLHEANLLKANLLEANLHRVDLHEANLCRANLLNVNLREADLYKADLHKANLCWANLHLADLNGADLDEANLYEANLLQAKLSEVLSISPEEIERRANCPLSGNFPAWKKGYNGEIMRLIIPSYAKRVSPITSRKCRCDVAFVLRIEKGGEQLSECYTSYGGVKTMYKVRQFVYSHSYDPSPLVECSPGIHFFITRQEAIDWR